MTTLSGKLKSGTRTSHKKIESTNASRQLLSQQLTKKDYNLILSCWYAFVRQYEARLLELNSDLNLLSDLQHRLKSDKLRADLGMIYYKVKLPKSSSEPTPLAPIDFWAYLYVMEGSAMGTQIIIKHLSKHTFINKKNTAFYMGYSGQTPQYWKTFKEQLNKWGEKYPELHEATIQSANNIFEDLRQLMEDNCTYFKT